MTTPTEATLRTYSCPGSIVVAVEAMRLAVARQLTPPESSQLQRIEDRVLAWMARRGAVVSRLAIGIVFLWFGTLKLFADTSPAEDLAGSTVLAMTGGLVEPWLSVPALGVWESLIGLALLAGKALRLTLLSFFLHMAGTTAPVILCPEEVFSGAPWALTLEGQYIVKNVVLVSAAMVVAAGLRRDSAWARSAAGDGNQCGARRPRAAQPSR